MLFVCYPKCATCQKARAFLDMRGIGYEFRDIRINRPTEEEIRDWHAKSGLPLRRLFNTSGLQYKTLGLATRLPSMNEAEQYRLLASDGMLVKRPILVREDRVLIGFRQSEWEGMLSPSGFTAVKG